MGNYVAANAATKSSDDSRLVTRYDVENSNAVSSSTATIDNEHLRIAIQSLDTLISKVVAEKTMQYQQQQIQHQQLSLSSTSIQNKKEENDDLKVNTSESSAKQVSIVNAELVTAFAASLANVLANQSGQLNSLIDKPPHRQSARRPSAVSSSPLYRCPMENNNCTSSRQQPQTGAGSLSDTLAPSLSSSSKVNYKNLFPRTSTSPSAAAAFDNSMVDVNSLFQENVGGLFGQMLQQTTQATAENRRMSNALIESMTNSVIGNGNNNSNSSNSNSPLDTVRINLPEILDAQDEITLLRLLIKLLSGKVTKLTEEKRRLLSSISYLGEINSEMAMLLERGIQK